MPIQPENPLECPLCRGQLVSERSQSLLTLSFNCPTCFSFIADLATANELYYREDRAELSGVVRDLNERGQGPVRFHRHTIDQFASLAPKRNDVEEKAIRLLRHITRRSRFPGDTVKLSPQGDRSLCYARDHREVLYYLQIIEGRDWVKRLSLSSGGWEGVVTPDGWQASQAVPNVESTKAFVAMWFHPKMQPAYDDGIKLAIENAGYEPIRVDRQQFLTKIDDRIIAEIREARFVVSDFSGNRGGVYYEAGYAAGRDIPVIYTCRASRIGKVHFDTRQYNHITWTDPADLREQLKNRILATIGRGPLAATQ